MKQNANFTSVTNQEGIEQNKTWIKGPFKHLLHRSEENYNKGKNIERRTQIESTNNIKLPILKDELLEKLYWKVRDEYYNKLQKLNSDSNGFSTTLAESNFLKSFLEIQSQIPSLEGIEIIPYKKRKKMCVGPYIPDFLLIGLSYKGCSLISIEIDGECHEYKQDKDFQKADNLHQFGIYTISITNDKVKDLNYLKRIFLDHNFVNLKKRSPKQVQTILRRIWIKTIANHWPIERIESEINSEIQEQCFLLKELQEIIRWINCPRDIKTEFKSLQNL